MIREASKACYKKKGVRKKGGGKERDQQKLQSLNELIAQALIKLFSYNNNNLMLNNQTEQFYYYICLFIEKKFHFNNCFV